MADTRNDGEKIKPLCISKKKKKRMLCILIFCKLALSFLYPSFSSVLILTYFFSLSLFSFFPSSHVLIFYLFRRYLKCLLVGASLTNNINIVLQILKCL